MWRRSSHYSNSVSSWGGGTESKRDTMCQSDAFTPKLILQGKKKKSLLHRMNLKCYYLNHLKMGACLTDSFWKMSHVLKSSGGTFSHAVFPTCPHEKSVLSSSSVKCINVSSLNTLPSHRQPHPPPSPPPPPHPRSPADKPFVKSTFLLLLLGHIILQLELLHS